ncbi:MULTISPECIES: ATP-grasp domain-containing protein [Methylotenera]|uniref:ATP-grasp domain-containing protein n=1 Tax=Methylotenera TaxID=359407 RepID=UPI00037237AA|nr:MULTISPECIES: RimK family alpha-L-glutamate ligase [Methylotenera]
MHIPIFTDEVDIKGGWHGAQLAKAFATHSIEAVFVSLRDCVMDLSGQLPHIQIPHFNALPKAAFVRGIAGGTLQQITTRLNILHMLKMQGVLIYNDAKAIERTVDKGMTSFLLHQAGIKTPQTWVCESRKMAHEIIHAEKVNQQKPLIIKPLFGSQGQGVRLVHEPIPLPMDAHVDGVFYLQALIKSSHDYRVFVVNNQAIAAMRRSGEGWLHNVALGANCEAVDDVDILGLAEKAAKTLDIAYCGVDIIRDESGVLYVLEVNSIPAWRGLQTVTQTNIAQALVDDCLSQLSNLNA